MAVEDVYAAEDAISRAKLVVLGLEISLDIVRVAFQVAAKYKGTYSLLLKYQVRSALQRTQPIK
jgi:hypothetical protein